MCTHSVLTQCNSHILLFNNMKKNFREERKLYFVKQLSKVEHIVQRFSYLGEGSKFHYKKNTININNDKSLLFFIENLSRSFLTCFCTPRLNDWDSYCFRFVCLYVHQSINFNL